jgi:hypothetical protein
MPFPMYDPLRDGPDVFAWILRASADERRRRHALTEPARERMLAQYRERLMMVRRLDERDLGGGA